MRDSYNRVIRSLRISITNRCNLHCAYCARPADSALSSVHLFPLASIVAVAKEAVELGIDTLRLTGGEPLLRFGVLDLVAELAAIPGLATLAMTTNGTLLQPLARPLAEAGLDSVNVSLDSLDSKRYARLTGGGRVEDAIAGVEAALAAGLPVKLNIVVEEGGPFDDAEAVERYAGRIGARTQRIRRYDLSLPKRDVPGFDRPPACGACDRIRLLADGRLLSCLHASRAEAVDMDKIRKSLLACIERKPARGAGGSAFSVQDIGG